MGEAQDLHRGQAVLDRARDDVRGLFDHLLVGQARRLAEAVEEGLLLGLRRGMRLHRRRGLRTLGQGDLGLQVLGCR